jgi:hypothetical protein
MKLVINVSGGVVQDVYTDDPAIDVILVDWDTEGCEPDGLVEIAAAGGALAHAVVYPTASLNDMPDDMREAVKKAIG